MIVLIRRRVLVVIALSVMIFSATTSVLAGLKAAPGAYVLEEGFVVIDGSAPTIFSSQVDASLADALLALDNVTAVEPEVLAFSMYDGQSFVVRGTDVKARNLQGEELAFSAVHTALMGSRLRERLGLELPCVLPLVGSYSDRVALVEAHGMIGLTGTSKDDELLVPLDIARHLAGMGEDEVSLIRVTTDEPGWLSDLLSPDRARFMLSDLRTTKQMVVVGEEFSASVKVTNWGDAPGEVAVTFSESGTVLLSSLVTVNGSSSSTVSGTLSFDALGEHEIVARVSGDMPVSLSLNVTVVDPYLVLMAPTRAVLGSELSVKVTDYLGSVVSGALVSFGSETDTTDSSGIASFTASSAGSVELLAEYGGLSPAEATVLVLDPAEYPAQLLPTVTSLSVSPAIVSEGDDAKGTVVVENLGSIGGNSSVTVDVDGSPYMTITFHLGPMESKTLTFTLSELDPGTHVVHAGTFAAEMTVEAWYSDDMDLVQLVLEYGGSTRLSSAGAVPVYQAAKISEGNIAVALFSIGAVSAIMSAVAVTSVFSKEVREGRRKLGILRTVGASSSAIRRMVALQALVLGLVGSAAGVALGALLSSMISESGALFVFGHQLSLPLDPPLLLLVLVGAVLISVSSALASAELAVRGTAIASIKRLPEEAPPPPDLSELLGDE